MTTFATIEAKAWHCGQMARKLRRAHAHAAARIGTDVHTSLTEMFQASPWRRAWLIDGKLAALGGVAGPMMADSGFVWLALAEFDARLSARHRARSTTATCGDHGREARTRHHGSGRRRGSASARDLSGLSCKSYRRWPAGLHPHAAASVSPAYRACARMSNCGRRRSRHRARLSPRGAAIIGKDD